MQVTGQYQVLRTGDSTSVLKQCWVWGAGIKMPTGRYNMYDTQGFFDRLIQPGTGSWDPLIYSQYTLRGKTWGMQVGADARISTTGADSYMYGHTLHTHARAFYWGTIHSFSVMASGGLEYIFQSKDYYLRQQVAGTGGHQIFATVSADFFIKKWMVGVALKLPVYAYLGNGILVPGPQIMAQLIKSF